VLYERGVALDRAREALSLAAWDALVLQGVRVGTLRFGYASDDPEGGHITLAPHAAQRDYGLSLEAYKQAQHALDQAERTHHRRTKELHVQRTQPELWLSVEEWQDKLLRATSDWQSAEAKKNVQAARYRYELAVAAAPVNGHKPH
jgi:hypothetical protein